MKNKILLLLILATQFLTGNSQNLNVTLAGRIRYPNQTCANIWGYVDSLGNEYALVGASNGLSIVNVTNPSAPFQVKQIPVANPGNYNNLWREVETYKKYAYVTTEAGGGLQIVDLSKLPDTTLPYVFWKPTINSQVLSSIHALHVDTLKGKVYLYGSNIGNQGAVIADVSTSPMNPVVLGNWNDRYIHDGYVRNDTLYAAHIYQGDCEIVDLHNPAAGVAIGDFQTPGSYSHNTWLSSNSKVCFTTDEVPNSFLTAFDISNLSNISELDRIQSNPGSNSYVHNVQIIKKNGVDYAVNSWYKDGFTIVDASRPFNLVQVGNYDTSPLSGSGMDGDWGVYPYLPSGTIIASDIDSGLFVCTPNYVRACYFEGKVVNCSNGSPISGVTVTIKVPLPAQSNANVDISDYQGKFEAGVGVPGTYTVTFSKTGYVTDSETVTLSAGIITTDTFNICAMGINELPSADDGIQIYPNPTSGKFQVSSIQYQVSGVEIYNVIGECINHQIIKSPNQQIDLSAVPNGIYFLQLETSEGVTIKKLVLSR